MTIYTGFDVEIGGFTSSTTVTAYGTADDSIDFTSRVLSIKVDHEIGLGEIGRSNVEVVLENNDGALSPDGSGTYGSYDWLAQPLFIIARAGTSNPPDRLETDALGLKAPFFGGPIVKFDYQDDGFTSTVTLEATDWLSFFARYTAQAASTETDNTFDVINNLAEDVKVSPYGAAQTGVTEIHAIGNAPENISLAVAKGDFLGDSVQTVAATEGGIVYAGLLLLRRVPSTTTSQALYVFSCITRARLTPNSGGDAMAGMKGTGSLSSTDLPIRKLKLAFNDKQIVTQAQITRTGGTSQYSYNDSVSQTYGPRSIGMSDLPFTSDAQSLSYAEFYTKRFNTASFVPSQFEITGSMIESSANDSALNGVKTLLHQNSHAYGALFKPTTISWTGAGSTSNTAVVTPVRLRLSVKPEDWVMQILCVDAASNMGFVLDSTQLGVLDQNRIT
jgi:hypothetical protein